jgi:ferredoxin-thioredoxin reductase catalytic subunit
MKWETNVKIIPCGAYRCLHYNLCIFANHLDNWYSRTYRPYAQISLPAKTIILDEPDIDRYIYLGCNSYMPSDWSPWSDKPISDDMMEKALKTHFEWHMKECEICMLNPDEKIVSSLVQGLIKRFQKFGDFFCPCKITPLNLNDKSTVCPCKDHQKEIEENGKCHCGLFVKRI